MSKTLVFLRQVFFPYRAAVIADKWETKPMIVGTADELPAEPVLGPKTDLVARIIGLILALFGTVSIGGLTIGEWFGLICQ